MKKLVCRGQEKKAEGTSSELVLCKSQDGKIKASLWITLMEKTFNEDDIA